MGTSRLLVKIYFAADSSGSGAQEVVVDTAGGKPIADWAGAYVSLVTPNLLKVQTGGLGLTRTAAGVKMSGFLRVVALGLP